jgi:hypothetical protein
VAERLRLIFFNLRQNGEGEASKGRGIVLTVYTFYELPVRSISKDRARDDVRVPVYRVYLIRF